MNKLMVAKRLRAVIDASGLSQSEWARDHGVTPGYVTHVLDPGRYLKGNRIVGYSMLRALNLEKIDFYRERPKGAPPLPKRVRNTRPRDDGKSYEWSTDDIQPSGDDG